MCFSKDVRAVLGERREAMFGRLVDARIIPNRPNPVPSVSLCAVVADMYGIVSYTH